MANTPGDKAKYGPLLADSSRFIERGRIESLESNAVLVLRYKHRGETKTRVWRGCTAYHVIKAAYSAATRVSEARTQRMKAWNPRTDAYVKENYHRLSTSQIAADLTAKFKRKFTKNMIISRYHRIKND